MFQSTSACDSVEQLQRHAGIMESLMEFASDPIETMGLRHVIEDGILGLESDNTEKAVSDRFKFALERLNDIVTRALRGAAMTTPSWHFAESGDMSALEIYSRMHEFFSETYKESLTNRLQEVSHCLSGRLSGDSIRQEGLQSTKGFLKDFLEKIEREEAFRKQSEPSFLKMRN